MYFLVLCPFLLVRDWTFLIVHTDWLTDWLTDWPSKNLLVFKTSSTRLQGNNFSSSKTSWRRLANASWRRLQDVFAKRIEDVLEDKKLLRWRRLEDLLEINKMFTKISVLIHGLPRNLNQYLTNLYLTNLYFTNLRPIQNALIRTQ